MRITFSPDRPAVGRPQTLEVHKQGDVLTINGEVFDFSDLPEGATLPRSAVRCSSLARDVERIEGRVHLTLFLPHGPYPSDTVAFPQALESPPDGVLTIPHDPWAEEVDYGQD
ncbi:hypothetical protein [Pelagibacterium sp. H642]|uniref:hypothetical protein n=1 Tax=Pelagibacterium sp. H642 TaxID=1881069 RepID=UPI002815B689|nr:hypothetical protein [Pelagibacterium sp. H642]WMT90172.1 hypothetical protein NO934_15445 [Pelagibacterium sp. H642]